MTVHVRLTGLNKIYGSHYAVKDLNLEIEEGSFTCLLGPSGCGKTTTLRMIAGFIEPDSGDITIGGVSQRGLPPHLRHTSIVFQEYALFPHMTVRENIGYGLRIKKLPAAERKAKADRMMEFLGLSAMADRLPKQLSGGQQQRVALGRSLVMEPEVLLMDEPLSNLDAKMRVKVRTELKEIQKRTGITTIYVTHDQEEALSIADRIAVMDQGLLQQYGAPWDLYFQPVNRFVADFIGANNFLKASVIGVEANHAQVQVGDHTLKVLVGAHRPTAGSQAVLSVRPESLTVSTVEGANGPGLRGRIKASSFLGAVVRYWVDIGGQEVMIDDHNPQERGVLSGEVSLTLEAAAARLFPA